MALAALSGDAQRIVFSQLCNVLDPGVANSRLWASTQALRQQLRADYEAAAALCRKMGMRSCKELRGAKNVECTNKGLSATNLTFLGSVLPALKKLNLFDSSGSAAGPDGVLWLAEGLGAGALPAVTHLILNGVSMSDVGASALAAALDRGAMPRLKTLYLARAAITGAGLVALAPALQRRPALDFLNLWRDPLDDEGLAALVAPPPLAGAPPPPAGVLAKLRVRNLNTTQITDVGCATLAAAIDSGALPALHHVILDHIPASAAAKTAINEALAKSRAAVTFLELG